VIVLDTHVLLWLDSGDPQLGTLARQRIEQAHRLGGVAVSAISFWECAMLARDKRILLAKPVGAWRAELLAAGLRELPLDGAVATAAVGLALSHQDPADRFIVATAQAHNADLLTADLRLLQAGLDVSMVPARV
jgi:PIN domain nuclease of toxin-antitoxin system